LRSNLRPAPQACGGRVRQVGAGAKHETSLGSSHLYPRVPSSSRWPQYNNHNKQITSDEEIRFTPAISTGRGSRTTL
jgi:hypothetical protein